MGTFRPLNTYYAKIYKNCIILKEFSVFFFNLNKLRAFLTEAAGSNEMSVYQIAEKISIFAHLDVFSV